MPTASDVRPLDRFLSRLDEISATKGFAATFAVLNLIGCIGNAIGLAEGKPYRFLCVIACGVTSMCCAYLWGVRSRA